MATEANFEQVYIHSDTLHAFLYPNIAAKRSKSPGGTKIMIVRGVYRGSIYGDFKHLWLTPKKGRSSSKSFYLVLFKVYFEKGPFYPELFELYFESQCYQSFLRYILEVHFIQCLLIQGVNL